MRRYNLVVFEEPGMPDTSAELLSGDRLDSWKDIAAYLKREVRTVQLWEKNEGLPIHRHAHRKRGTVYASRSELDLWWNGRCAVLQEQNSQPPRRWPVALAGALGLCLVGGAVWLGIPRRPSSPAAEPKVIPLTSDPGSEMGASFSPDGNQIAFAWRREGRQDFDIYVKVVGSERELQLTSTSDWDANPAWSPDGREIAFHRWKPSGWCAVYAVSPLGGPERLIAELAEKDCGCPGWLWNDKLSPAQLSWSPDSKWLARPGISLLSMETGKHRKLTSPPAGTSDLYPGFSPDGKSLAFVRWVRSGVDHLYVIPVAGGEPRHLPTQERMIYGLAWTSDGRELIYSSGKWAFGDADLFRVSLAGGSPRRLAEGNRAWLPSISGQGRLAFTRKSSDTNIWQVRGGDATGQQDTAVRLITSTRAEARPAFSPDGRQVAFMSDRSGTFQVWICDRDGSNAKQLTSFPEPGAGMPAWSPDGRQIAFDSSANGDYNVYVIPVTGGAPRRLTPESTAGGMSPTWSGDGRWVYFSSTRTGRHEIFKIPAQGGNTVQLTKHGGQLPVESPDGQFIYYEKGPTSRHEFEPWRVAVNGGMEEPVAENLGTRWTLMKDGLYFYHEEQAGDPGGPWMLKFFEFATAKKHVVARLNGRPLLGHRPAVSPDRRTFLYVQLDLNETDLLLLEDFQ